MTPLTDRERDVARLVADGLTDKQIAADLKISQRRIRQLVGQIAKKWHLDYHRDVRVQIANKAA